MITSCANDKVKRIVGLQEKSKNRAKENVFVAEGLKMFEEAPMEMLTEIYIEEKLFETMRTGVSGEKLQKCINAKVPVETVSKEVFAKMSDTQSPQGILCVMKRHTYRLEGLIEASCEKRKKEGHTPLFLMVEDVQDPGNLGTMMRTAEGAGADGLIFTKGTVDIYNPKTIRSTMGSLYRVPFVYVDSLDEAIKHLKEKQIKVYAAHLKGEKFYHEFSYQDGAAFMIGNEGNGLKKETADMADAYLKIPMEGQLESLNAAVAAALLMYQAALGRMK